MSLLDDVSIVVTPNGYKAGELYAVVPTNALGSEQVTNGDYTEAGVGNVISQSGGVLVNDSNRLKITSDGSGLYSRGVWETNGSQGERFIIKADIISTSGTVRFIDISNNAGTSLVSGTTFEIEITLGSSGKQVGFGGLNDSSFEIILDNVSVKEITGADMDVTRATAATRVDEDGLVNYAEIVGDSILTGNNSNFDTGIGSWVTYNGGTLAHSTDKLEVTLTTGESGARIDTNSLISGGQIGKTFKVRARIWQGTTSNTLFRIYIGSVQESVTISSTPTYFEVELTPSSTGMLTIYRAGGLGGVGTYFIDDVTVKEVTRDNVPRIDYTGGGCPHILSEPQRTNTLSYSEDFETSGWGIYNSTLETDAVISPNGILNATKLIGTNDVTAHTLYTNAYTVVASVDYTHSVFIKKSQSKYVQLYTGSGFGNYYANFNLEDGIVETFTTLDANIENIGDGWYKCSTKANSSTTTAQSTVALIDTATSGRGYAFNAEDESVYIWGAQIEQGSYATSYIPTSGSSVTRNQDIFTRDGIGSLINSTEGVLFVEMAKHNGNTVAPVISLNNGTSSQTVALYYFSTDEIAFDVISSSPNVSGVSSSYNTDNFNKIALKYKSGDIALWVNGVEVLTKTNTISLTGLNKISFDYGNGTYSFFGKVKQLQVYNTALTDEQLLQLTGTSGTDFYESYAEMASALTYTIQ